LLESTLYWKRISNYVSAVYIRICH